MLIELALIALVTTAYFVHKAISVPPGLRHLPRVPLLPLLWSYFSGEVEADRIKRLLLPFANERGEGVVVVWALGRWMVHILNIEIAQEMATNIQTFPKQPPPDSLLIWKLVGASNVLLTNGDTWKRHSKVIRHALKQTLPIHAFSLLSRRLFDMMGSGGRLSWDDLSQRFALDAVGTNALGYNFEALESDKNPFVSEYNAVMTAIANPFYLVMPALERWLPRPRVLAQINSLLGRFGGVLEHKKENKGNDMITFMLEDPSMSDIEYRDNMALLFMAGHDTTAGALSSLVYYLAVNPDAQAKAREEVLRVMGDADPSIELYQKMPYLQAIIRESLRVNTPITYIVPRSSSHAVRLGKYDIPANVSLVINMCALHYNSTLFPLPEQFIPERFLKASEVDEDVDASSGVKDVLGEAGWAPFGLGPRQCPARNFALYEQRVLVSMLLREYEWTLPKGSMHEDRVHNAFSPFALSLPHHMEIDFVRRR